MVKIRASILYDFIIIILRSITIIIIILQKLYFSTTDTRISSWSQQTLMFEKFVQYQW